MSNCVSQGLLGSALYEKAKRLGGALVARGWQLGLAESCTGGGVATVVTDVPGASGWFEGGFVVYANRAKQAQLGVPESLILESGAVSAEVVSAMVAGLFQRTGAHLGAAISGIAGPDGGTQEKPVGTVWFGFGVRSGLMVAEHQCFSGDRRQVRLQAIQYCLSRLLSIAQDSGEGEIHEVTDSDI